jgi:hypothetical protein
MDRIEKKTKKEKHYSNKIIFCRCDYNKLITILC